MELKIGNKGDCKLTTEHAGHSYGQPVLVIDGNTYGCGDALPGTQITAGQMVANLHNRGVISGEMVDIFIAPLRVL